MENNNDKTWYKKNLKHKSIFRNRVFPLKNILNQKLNNLIYFSGYINLTYFKPLFLRLFRLPCFEVPKPSPSTL